MYYSNPDSKKATYYKKAKTSQFSSDSYNKKKPPFKPFVKYAKKYTLPEDDQEFSEKFVEDKFIQTRPFHESTFQNLVEIAANKYGMGRQLTAIRICHEAKKVLVTLLPESHHQIQVISFKNKTLTLRADNASLRQRMHIKSHLLQETLNREFQKEIIEKVFVQV